MNIIVVSDVHANFQALQALDLKLKSISFEKIIVLGDVLTYGVEVEATIELLKRWDSDYDMVFIKGNHDQIYFDFQNNKNYQYKVFPEFIDESVVYTASLLNDKLEMQFTWQESYVYENILFSHANAYRYGDWSYVNVDEDFKANLHKIIEGGFRGAIFGHTHRGKCYLEDNMGEKFFVLPSCIDIPYDSSFIITNGSLGQPRGSDYSVLHLSATKKRITSKVIPIDFDVKKHRESISRSSLTPSTKERLLSFYS